MDTKIFVIMYKKSEVLKYLPIKVALKSVHLFIFLITPYTSKGFFGFYQRSRHRHDRFHFAKPAIISFNQ